MHSQTQLPLSQFARPAGWYKYFGLYDQENKAPIPLKQILVDAKINEYIAEISYSQLYFNNLDVKLEAVYFFPISNTGCFHNFKARIGTKTIEGVIKKKEEARQEYELSTANNELAIYAETMEQDSSIMCIKIGNLPPKIEVEITLSYIERVEVSMNKFWSFSLSSTFLPRSLWSSGDKYGILTNYAQADLSVITEENIHALIGFNWDVDVLINSKRPFELLDSPSHKINVVKNELGGCYSAKVTLSADKTCLPDKDFVLNYRTDALNTPNCLIGPFDKGYCALISFSPDMSYLKFDDAYMAYLQGRSPYEDLLSKAKNEFLFVVDQSEHMTLEKANLAREILRQFLKQLPSESYFNIVDFAGEIVAFEKQSVEANAENIKRATLFAGETPTPSPKADIASLFDYLVKVRLKDKYPRNVIFLTGGKVNVKTSDVVRLMNDKLDRCRVFTVGIGNNCRTDFVMQTAVQGYGRYTFIRNHTEIPEKVSHILQSSVAPYFTDFDLEIGTKGIHSCIVPVPKTIRYVMPDDLVEFFVIFTQRFNEDKSTKFTLKFKNEFRNCTEKYEGEISLKNMDPLRAVVMLGIQRLCANHMEEIDIANSIDNDITRIMAENLKKAVENNSIQHGILTPQTAFICVDKNDELQQTSEVPTQKFVITGQKEPQSLVETNLVHIKKRGEEPSIRGMAQETVTANNDLAASNMYKFKIPNGTKLEKDKGTQKSSEQKRERYSIEVSRKDSHEKLMLPQVAHDVSRSSLHSNDAIDRSQQPAFSTYKSHLYDQDMTDSYQTNRPALPEINKVTPPGEKNLEMASLDVSANTNSVMNKSNAPANGKQWSIHREETVARTSRTTSRMVLCCDWMKQLFCFRFFRRSGKPASFDFKVNALPRVIQLQDKDGYWEGKRVLTETLNYRLEELMKPLPKSLEMVKEREEIWLTLLMLAWIDHVKQTPDQQSACNRAFKWLKLKDEDCTEHLERAKIMVGNR